MNRRILLGLMAGTLALVPFAASAHGPTRQKVTETVDIKAPVDKVWAIVGDFQNMNWHPGVAKTEGTGGNEPMVALRTLTLKDGNIIEENLEKYDATKMSYFYRIKNDVVKFLPIQNYSSTISVKANGDMTTVEWKGAFYRGYMNNDPPPELNDEAAIKAIKALYRAGLDNLKTQIEAGG